MIRQATVDDYQSIQQIRSKIGLQREKLQEELYLQKVEKEGFLLYPTISLDEYKEEIQQLFLVFVEESIVKGFIHIDTAHAISSSSPVVWNNEEIKNIYFSNPHAYVSGIAVDPQFAHHGIATQLLQEAIKHLSQETKNLFSIVVVSPVHNTPSIVFHGKNGFKEVGRIAYAHRADLDNYKSIVYAKKLG